MVAFAFGTGREPGGAVIEGEYHDVTPSQRVEDRERDKP